VAILVNRSGAIAALEASCDLLGAAVSASRDARVRRAVHEHHAMVYRLLRRMGVPERDAEDAQQQVFWVFARNLERVEAGCDKAFLFGVAVRVARAVRRRLGRLEPVDDGVLESLPAPAAGVDDELDEWRARAVLDALLEAMPHDLRVVVVLHDLEEWTMREIAAALSLRPGTVASRLRRARELLERLARASGHERTHEGNGGPR
jgi:RNA polymerase sigma-70 factor (ECF subfamily)